MSDFKNISFQKPEQWFLNEYHCADCEETWDDEWSSTCNDHCPSCDAEVEPRRSTEISEHVDWDAWKKVSLNKKSG